MIIDRLKYKWWAKLLAAVLLFIAGFGCFAGAVGIYACVSYRVYSESADEAQLRLNREMLSKYSVLAMADYVGAADRKLSPNYHYAILEGSGTNGKVVAGDLTEGVPEDAVIHEFTITDSTAYKLADSMFHTAYVQAGNDDQIVEENIQKIYYSANTTEDRMDGGEYAGEGLTDLYVTGLESGGSILYPVDPELYRVDEENGVVWFISMSGYELAVPIPTMEKLDPWTSDFTISPCKVSCFYLYDDFGGLLEEERFLARDEQVRKVYTVAGTVAEERSLTGNWLTADFFEQVQILLAWLYMIRYPAIVLALACLILGLFLFVFLMMAAGHRGRASRDSAGSSRKGDLSAAAHTGVRLLAIDRMPMDLAFGLAAGFCWLCAVFVLRRWSMWVAPVKSFSMFGVCFAAAYVPAIAFCMSFAANVKAGGWRERTLIYRIGKLLKRFFSGGWRSVSRLFGKIKKPVSTIGMGKRAWALFAFFVICELTGLIVFRNYHRRLMACWVVEKCIFFPALLKFLLDFGKIKQVSTEIAGGNLDYKVETKKMLMDFADVGNSLNAIGDGMAAAIEERMKSERMKTELITNVSHDIKTPLTSIINYTDLLIRLDLQDPTAREYLEVLGRQSARLKKLIEDLIEASKASSGVLKLEMEAVNVSMLLMQALGEYEERFSQNGLDLRVTGDQSDLKVMADSRYLWRVFDNMMSNMLKYAQPGTRAYIDLISEDDAVRIIFRNISEMPLHISGEELMERFVRGDSSRTTEGSGLGLSIADSLVTLMGGTMEIIVDGDLFKVIVTLKTENDDAE